MSYDRIMEQAGVMRDMDVDMVEWRSDFYEDIGDAAETLRVMHGLRRLLGEIPILFTFRTKKEGGEREISTDYYTELNTAVAQSGEADFIDVEIFSGDEVVARLIRTAHDAKVLVVGSNHDFSATPPREELVKRLRKMQDMGADILKIAVMPKCKQDVLTLLAATNEMYEQYADRPLITMSMSSMGLLSRLSGEMFGSAMTFGAAGGTSAPGQIPVRDLEQVLDIVHKYL